MISFVLYSELEGSETINKNMEAHLHQTRSQVEGILSISHQIPPTRLQIDEVQKALQQGLTIAESIIQKLGKLSLKEPNFSFFLNNMCIHIFYVTENLRKP